MSKANPKTAKKLTEAHVAITNIRANADIQTALSTYGYTPERLQHGDLLREAAKAQCHQTDTAYGGLRTATDTLASMERQARADYMRYVKIARVTLADDRGALRTLGLTGQRKKGLAGWIAQAQQFYAGVLADDTIQSQLTVFNLTRSLLEAGALQVETVNAQIALRTEQRGTARNATSVRNAALHDLDMWMSDLKAAARRAFRNNLKPLEKIGITVKEKDHAQQPEKGGIPVKEPT